VGYKRDIDDLVDQYNVDNMHLKYIGTSIGLPVASNCLEQLCDLKDIPLDAIVGATDEETQVAADTTIEEEITVEQPTNDGIWSEIQKPEWVQNLEATHRALRIIHGKEEAEEHTILDGEEG
jgi:hypothetical protein